MKKTLFLFVTLFFFANTFATDLNLLNVSSPTSFFVSHENLFDLNILSDSDSQLDFSIKVMDNGVLALNTAKSFNAGEHLKTFQLSVIPATAGTHTLDFNVIYDSDTNQLNNAKTLTLTATPFSGPDLIAKNVVIDANIQAGKSTLLEAIVENSSDSNANNVLVRIYHLIEQPANLVFEAYFSLPAHATKSGFFQYMPQVPGQDMLILTVDEDNKFSEPSETNNRKEISFTVLPQESTLTSTPYTLSLRIRKKCEVVLSNFERFVSYGIFQDVNTFYLQFALKDALGNNLLSGNGYTDKEFVATGKGRTIRFFNVEQATASVMLVYTIPIAIQYSECEENIDELMNNLNTCEASLKTVESNMADEVYKRRIAEADFESLKKENTTCNEDLANCKTDKGNCETKIVDLGATCDTKVLNQKQYDEDNFNIERTATGTALLSSNVAAGLFVLTTVLGAAYIYLFRKRMGM